MTLDLRKSFISGRPRHLTSPPAVPAGLHVALIVLGAGPGALERILPHALLKFPGLLPALAPPRILVRGQKIPSPGMVEAAAARKARAVGRTVLAAKALRGASFVLDLTPAAEVVLRRLAKVPPKQRHPLLLAALAAWVPDLSGYGQVITVLEYPLGDIPLDERVLLLNKATFAADHVLLEAATGGPQLGDVVRDPSLLFLANLGTGTVVRLDPADRHTTGKRRFIMAIRASEHALAPHLPEAIAGAAALPRPAPQAAGEPDQLPDEIADVAPGAVPDPAQQRREERIAALREAHARVPFPTLSGPARPLAEILVAGPIRPPTVSVAPGTFADPAVTRPSFAAITTSYVAQGHYDRDLASALDSLSRDPVAPTFVEEVTREDTSDGLTTKETMTVRLRDAAGRSGTLHVDLPTISHDGYLHLQGVKYHIAKQIMALPIIKVRPDEVLVTTAYNKAMVSRFGQNASARTAYVRRLAIALDRERAPGVTVELGSATAANAGFTSTVEYDDLARTLRSIRSGRGALVFSRPALAAQLPGVAPWAAPLLAGLERAGGHAIGWETSREGRPPSVLATDAAGDLLVLRKGAKEPEALGLGIDELVALGVGDRAPPPSAEDKKYAFSRTKMLSQYLPTITIAGFCDGLARTLRRAGVDFAIVDPQAFRRSTLGPGRAFVRFSDAVLTYDARRLAHSLLVNGLRDADTGERKIADYGPQGQGWADQIAERLGSPGHVKGLLNFRASFVDPATAELLAAEGIPTDMAGILLHASAMLESNGHRDANDISNYRIRGPELIPALLYKALHREMERVRATRESAIPQRLSIAQGEIVRQVLGASNVEEVADLNPLLEAELRGKATWTGAAGGLSDGRVVNLAMRTFHPSMKGVFGYYSPDSSEIGVKRSLTYGVSVLDHRGRLAPRPESPGAAELLALGELISPFTARHSDPPRTGMQSKQGTHTFPTKRHTPLLVGSGAERALAHAIGNTFAHKARAAGRVEKIDAAQAVAKLLYDDGTRDTVDLSARSAKNAGGGFYITARLELAPGLREGSRVAAGQVVASDPNFFVAGPGGETSYKGGVLARVALAPLDQTYEDSVMVSSRLAERTAALVTMMRPVSLGPRANLQSLAKVGDVVSPGTPLAVFENVSDDADVAGLLARVGQEFDEAIGSLAKNVALAKYAGRIVEVRTYYNREPTELSQSLQAHLRRTDRAAAGRAAAVGRGPRSGAAERVTRDKIDGELLDGVLIEFFIQVEEETGPGDKMTLGGSALKGVVSRVFEPGEEPAAEDGTAVDYVISPLSVISRMTIDFFLVAWANAVLVETKKRVLEIYAE